MKYLIIGLGNPGAEYENTRHNIGFKVLDALVSASNTSFTTDRYADVAEVKFKGRNLVLIKPNTFMNLSGKAVNYWLQNTKIDVANMLVVTDDISLPFGVLRMRKKGSDGGHNGLKGIQEVLGLYLKKKLKFKVTILCTGGAISFFTGDQAPINIFIDKYYLGWLVRLFFNPFIFFKRCIIKNFRR